MTVAVEELRPLTAGRLLAIRREAQADGTEEWALSAVCNARVLAECCYAGGERIFSDGGAVLEAMTLREIESLVRQLAGEEMARSGCGNPNFDPTRFRALKEA